jgi:hypothetical protein
MKFSTLLASSAFTVAALSSPAFSGVVHASARPVLKPIPASTSWVKLKVTTDQKQYAPGQPIQVRLTATNTHNKGAYLHFTSGQRFDFSAYPLGRKDSAYSWSASRSFMAQLGSLWLKPGQKQTYDATLGEEMGQLKPGRYRLFAHLSNAPRPVKATPIEFEIVSPPLAITATTDKSTYKIGEPVKINVAIANRAKKATQVDIKWGLPSDVLITDAAGQPVWNYGANIRFVRMLGLTTWNKNETKAYSQTWNGVALPRETETALEPGRYQVQAVLQTSPLQYSAPVYITLTR